MKSLISLLSLFILGCATVTTSCGPVNLPPDYAENYAKLGYYGMEFDTVSDTTTTKQLGISTVLLKEEQPLDNLFVDFYGVYQGQVRLLSQGCPVNYTVTFKNKTRFAVKNWMPTPQNCTIQWEAITGAINGLQHNVVEIGKTDFFLLPKGKQPIQLSYFRSTPYGLRQEVSQGTIALQRPEGSLSYGEKVYIQSPSKSGTMLINSSCPQYSAQVDLYSNQTIEVPLNKLYSKIVNNIRVPGTYVSYQKDSCDFFFMLVPDDLPYSYMGKFIVNIYNSSVVPLELASWSIKNKKLYASGGAHIAVTSINDKNSTVGKTRVSNQVNERYFPNNIYWVRAITINGRKSVFAIKDGQLYWW